MNENNVYRPPITIIVGKKLTKKYSSWQLAYKALYVAIAAMPKIKNKMKTTAT